MKILKIIIILSGSFFLSSCLIEGGSSDLSSFGDSRTPADSRTNRRARQSSRSGHQCEDSTRCRNICDRILDYTKERLECYNLSLKDIGDLEDVIEELVEPSSSSLSKISSRDFDFFMEIGYRTWNNIIIGRYRIDEAYDDDDEDMDDWEDFEYGSDEAKAVLDWLVAQSGISEALRDFSGSLAEEILYNILVRTGASPTSDSNLSSLDNEDKQVLEALSLDFSVSHTYLSQIVRDGGGDTDSVSALYEVTHNMVSDICERNSISGQSSRDSHKICLSTTYFCPNGTSSGIRWQDTRYYLLRDSYRNVPESGAYTCPINREVDWGDYWD